MRLVGLFLVGTIAFVAITYFEQVPVLGWSGVFISIAAWLALGRAAARDRATLGFVPMLVGAVLRDAAPLVRDVVHENVLTKMLRLDVKGAAIVDLRHLVHEVHQIVSAREHERVDGDALARAAHDLAKRLLEGLLRRRIREARAGIARFEMGGWLAVGDEDDLLVLPA